MDKIKPENNTPADVNFKRKTDDYHWVNEKQMHNLRRKQIFKAHPEIAELFKPDIRMMYVTIALVVSNILLSYYFATSTWLVYLTATYWVSGSITHVLMECFHATGHRHVFESEVLNDLLGIFANFGQGVPSAISFKNYHLDHHIYLGEDKDPDIATKWEVNYIKTPFRKFFFLVLLVFFYSLRPMFTLPKKPTKMEILNIVSVFLADYLIYKFSGLWGLIYIVLGTVLGMGFHPFAFHFIARHYEFKEGVETYSYYGWFNILQLNMGYHVEHHDFPNVPAFRLPLVSKIAKEYYRDIAVHTSYWKMIYEFIFNDKMGPWSRIKRKNKREIDDTAVAASS